MNIIPIIKKEFTNFGLWPMNGKKYSDITEIESMGYLNGNKRIFKNKLILHFQKED